MSIGRWLSAVSIVGVATAAYIRAYRPWQLTWGAMPDEVSRRLHGDEVVSKPTFNATRAITVKATPEEIWPWLLQVGITRGGWYSYDLLDNLGRPSAHEIMPELQSLAVGDVVPISPDGRQGFTVLALDLPRSMLWGTMPDVTWLWLMEPRADSSTRVITRIRMRYRWLSPSIAFSLLIEFADIWMIRRMLLNLRERAESLSRTRASHSPSTSRAAV
jgi:hypothetical protein